ncbi:hypothetical protein ACFV4N_25710 [Actinosynnema sp. NPDC059797]
MRHEQDRGLGGPRGLDPAEVRDPLLAPAEVREEPADDVPGPGGRGGEGAADAAVPDPSTAIVAMTWFLPVLNGTGR